MREVILDTETTGLDPNSGHKIIEIALIEMINNVLTGRKLHYYINPERDVPDDAYRIHGISTEFLRDKPLFKDIANEFITFVKNSKVVIHNAPFDIKFLNYELTLLNLPSMNLTEIVDTLTVAKKMFPGSKVNLDALCKRFKVDNRHRQFHGALKDAYLLSEIYVELLGGRQVTFNLGKTDYKDLKLKESFQYTRIHNRKVIIPTDFEIEQHNLFLSKLYKLKKI